MKVCLHRAIEVKRNSQITKASIAPSEQSPQSAVVIGNLLAPRKQDNEGKKTVVVYPKRNKTLDDRQNKKRDNCHKLRYAAETGKVEEIKQLLSKEELDDLVADINDKGLDDFTALHFAVSEGHNEAVKALLSFEPDIESVTRSLKTPLHMACNRGDLKIIKSLVEAGANINAKDRDWNTPSHILASLGLASALIWLLERKPDLSIKNCYGERPVDISANIEIKKIFEKYDKPTGKNNYSRTVMDGVILHNNRADTIKSFMFRAQLMGQTAEQRYEEQEEIKFESKPINKSGGRIMRILEIVERIKSASPKVSPKKEANQNTDGVASAEDFVAVNLLGKGAFGEVYLVKHKKTGKLYALKTLDKKRMLDQNTLRYTKTERDVLRVTKHPFIVGFYYAFQNSEKLFMIMQYCPG